MRDVLIGLGILIAVVVVGAIILLHTSWFHGYVLNAVEQRASAALGVPVKARDFDVTWSGISPTVDLYGVVVQGAPPHPNPPLLTVERLRVGVTISSVINRTWYLNDLTVDHPVLRVFVDQNGADNLPKMQSSGQSSGTNLFSLGVRHALLDRGEAFYNNRKSVLNADLHNLTLKAAYQASPESYTGTLSYDNGQVVMGNYNPLPHSLDAKFSVTPTEFKLEDATLRSGPSRLQMTATVTDFAHPRAGASYHASLDTGELRRVMKNPSLPSGTIQANGTLTYTSEPNRPLLDSVVLHGTMSSPGLKVQTPSLTTQVRNIAANYSLEQGNVEVRDIRAQLLGGELTGTLTMRDLTGNTRSSLRADLNRVNLAQLEAMAPASSLKNVSLAGGANATLDATWGKTMESLVVNTNATLQARVAPSAGGEAVPVNGVLHAHYSAPTGQVTLNNSYLRTPQTTIALNGTVSNRSALQVNMHSNDLHEVESLMDVVRPPQPGQAPLGLYGSGSFVGQVSGSTSAPHVTGQLTASNLRFEGSQWNSVRANVNLTPSMASLQNVQLVPQSGGQITANLTAPLQHWALNKTGPLQVQMNVNQVNAGELAKLTGTSVPVTGKLSGNVSLHGTMQNPVGTGNLKLSSGSVYGQPVQSATVKLNGNGNALQANLTMQTNAGTTHGTFTYSPKAHTYQVNLNANGINLAQLQAVKNMNLGVTGKLNLSAHGAGTPQNPLLIRAEIPQLQVRGQTITNLALQASVANKVATYTLNSDVVNTTVNSHGIIDLTGNYFVNATLDTQSIPLQPLLAAFAPDEAGQITGATELHATIHGPLKNMAQLQAQVVIPQLSVNYKNVFHLAPASPIQMQLANGILRVQRTTIRGTDTDLRLQAAIPVANRAAPMSLLLQGTVGLKAAELLDPNISSGGQLRFDINSYGQRSNPNVVGQVYLENVSFASGAVPVGLQNGNGVLTLTPDRLDITRFQGTVGGGTVDASGGVVYRPSLKMDLGLTAHDVRVLYQNQIRAAFGGRLALTGTTNSALLQGQVRILRVSFTPSFDLQNFMSTLGGGATLPAPTQSFTQDLKLNVDVSSAGGVNVQSRELALAGTANVRVVGTAAQPVILGRVNLSGGDLIFSGNRYLLQAGTIDFVNPSITTPVVNVALSTTIQQYNIRMRFWGPVDQMHTSYTSDPALPPADILNLVVRGTTTEAAAANPSPPGMLGAESLVAGAVSSQVTSRISELAGISQLSVDPVLGGNGKNPGARVAVQQRVTSKIYVDFATDLTSTQNEVIKLEYHHSRKVSFSATRDQNGGFGFDTTIHKNW